MQLFQKQGTSQNRFLSLMALQWPFRQRGTQVPSPYNIGPKARLNNKANPTAATAGELLWVTFKIAKI